MDDVDLNVDVEEGTDEGHGLGKGSGGASPDVSPAIAGGIAGGGDASMGALTGSQGVLSPPTFFKTSEVSLFCVFACAFAFTHACFFFRFGN